MVYQTEKQLKEFGEKVPAEVKSKIEGSLQTLRDAIAKDDTEAMTKGIEALRTETMAMGQAMYGQVGIQSLTLSCSAFCTSTSGSSTATRP